MSSVGVIIPAGGAGVRLGGLPKAQLVLHGHPLLRLAIAPFLERPDVVQVVVALPAGMLRDPAAWLQYPRIRLVEGGAERMHSVRAALEVLTPEAEIVVIHDAARPLVSRDLIARVIAAASRGNGAIAALPASDTIHEVDDRNLIRGTLDRSRLWQAQTPQAFPRAMLAEAHRMAVSANIMATDDAALVLHSGGQVEVITGERTNLKITIPDDIHLAEAILAQRS